MGKFCLGNNQFSHGITGNIMMVDVSGSTEEWLMINQVVGFHEGHNDN